MKFTDTKEKVNTMYRKAESCDLKVIDEIVEELDTMKVEIHSEMDNMMKNETVLKYIDLQKSLACVNEAKFYMGGYYPNK